LIESKKYGTDPKKNIFKKNNNKFFRTYYVVVIYILKQLKELMRTRARPHFVQGFLGFKGDLFGGER